MVNFNYISVVYRDLQKLCYKVLFMRDFWIAVNVINRYLDDHELWTSTDFAVNVINRYLDDHELWTSTDFAVDWFKLIVSTVQVSRCVT